MSPLETRIDALYALPLKMSKGEPAIPTIMLDPHGTETVNPFEPRS